MSELQQKKQHAEAALQSLQPLMQAFQNIQAQITAMSAPLQNQNILIAQNSVANQLATLSIYNMATATSVALPLTSSLFLALTNHINTLKFAIDELCTSYTNLLTKLSESSPLQAIISTLDNFKLSMTDSVIVINQNIEGGSNWYDSLMNTINAVGTTVLAMGEYKKIGLDVLLLLKKIRQSTIFLTLAQWANTAATWAMSRARAIGAAITNIFSGIQKRLSLLTMGYTAIQWLLNTAMLANPVFLIVMGVMALIAAIVVAWHKIEAFRNAVKNIGEALKKFFLLIWEKIQDIIGGIAAIFNKIKSLFGFDTPENDSPDKQKELPSLTTSDSEAETDPQTAPPPETSGFDLSSLMGGFGKGAEIAPPASNSGGLAFLMGGGPQMPTVPSAPGASGIPGIPGAPAASGASTFDPLALSGNTALGPPSGAPIPLPASQTSTQATQQTININNESTIQAEHVHVNNEEEVQNMIEMMQDKVVSMIARAVQEISPGANPSNVSYA